MLNNSILRFAFFVAVTILTVFIMMLFFQYDNALKKAYVNIEEVEKVNVNAFAKNIEDFLKKDYRQSLEKPFDIDQNTREKIDKTISMFTGGRYAYIFFIAHDKKGGYRYIFDGAKDPKEKGMYLQKFSPASDVWDEVVENKKPQWITQNSINGLWLTYLYPIMLDGKMSMILAFDFSIKEYLLVKSIFAPINNYLMIIAFILGLLLIFIYFFGYLFYKQRRRTFVDHLTGTFNRHYLHKIENTIKLKDFYMALIDLDHFKRVNDIYGHDAGDEVLKVFSQRLKSILSRDDILIRYGGEEFLLFLSKRNIKIDEETKIIFNIQNKISSEKFEIKKDKLQVTVSIGFNATPHLSRSLNDAINATDKMLYVAKINGRNRVEFFEEKSQDEDAVFGPVQIQEALKEGRVKPYYQPIMDAKTKQIIKYEMLVRVFTKTGKMILPFKFLPNIRSNSSYRDMSKYMLESAVKTIQEEGICVSLNFDVKDFLDETLYEQIYYILSGHKNLSSCLTIELLENTEIEDFELVKKHIQKIKDLGIKIAIDDFGSGYSSFNYLIYLNPDILKIDGCLIKEVLNNPQAKQIIASIIALCKDFGIKVVAEFVENQAIIDELCKMEVDFLQGYAIGKPAPTPKILK